jgi:energy-converting hydrogenase B subunit D
MFSSVGILNTLIMLGVLICALLAATLKKTLSAVIALGAVGSFTALEFIMLQAPDVAIAEAAVGVVLSTVIYVVALRKTGGEDEK